MENKLKSQRKKDPAETTTTQTQRISVQFPKMKLEICRRWTSFNARQISIILNKFSPLKFRSNSPVFEAAKHCLYTAVTVEPNRNSFIKIKAFHFLYAVFFSRLALENFRWKKNHTQEKRELFYVTKTCISTSWFGFTSSSLSKRIPFGITNDNKPSVWQQSFSCSVFFFCSLASFELNDLFSICRNREMQYAIKWLWLAGCSSQPNAPVKQKVSDRGETHAHRKIVAACIQQHTCHPDQTVTLFCFRVHFLLLLVRKWEKKVNARLKGKFYSSLLGAFICLE